MSHGKLSDSIGGTKGVMDRRITYLGGLKLQGHRSWYE